MKLSLIMLETPIIVSDEEIKDGDYFLYNNEVIKAVSKSDIKMQRVIAGIPSLPSINFNGFEEQLGIVDFEKLANKMVPNLLHAKWVKLGFINGLKAAQQLNEKKFSLEDMANLWQYIVDGAKQLMLSGTTEVSSFENYIQSLQQPKIYDIEVEMEEYYDEELYKIVSPKITNNQIKITKIL